MGISVYIHLNFILSINQFKIIWLILTCFIIGMWLRKWNQGINYIYYDKKISINNYFFLKKYKDQSRFLKNIEDQNIHQWKVHATGTYHVLINTHQLIKGLHV